MNRPVLNQRHGALRALRRPMWCAKATNPLIFCVVSLLYALPAIATDYYVSKSGDDDNSGTTVADAWQSIVKVNGIGFAPGDVIHFECGGEWRGQLVPSSGSPQGHLTYTSYGEGPKPLLLGSLELNKPNDWQPVGTNLWQTRPLPVDVGNIIFNNGQSCGIKMWDREDVNAANKFCYDRQQKTVVLYATKNPAKVFDDIECALKRHIINQGGRSYVVYDGLHLAYGGAHGIGGGGTHHITVRNCCTTGDQGELEPENALEWCKVSFFNFLYDSQLLNFAAFYIGLKTVVDIHHDNRSPWLMFAPR